MKIVYHFIQPILIFALAAIALISCSNTKEGDLIIKNVNIIDVKTGEVDANQDVVINADTIVLIASHEDNIEYISELVIDGTDQYIIPGLWDMHSHTWGNEYFFPMLLANGVTGIREMFGGDLNYILEVREKIKNREIQGPDIITSGPLVDGPGGWPMSDVAETPEDAREIVRKQAENGADFIKVYSSLDQDVFAAIADECHKISIPFAGHVPDKIKLEDVINAGQRSIEHFIGVLDYTTKQRDHYYAVVRGEIQDTTLSKFDDWLGFIAKNYDSTRLKPLIKLLSENEVWIVPTSPINRVFAYVNEDVFREDDRIYYLPPYVIESEFMNPNPDENSALKNMTPEDYEHQRLWYHQGLDIMKPMLDGGVKFMAGTDSPNLYCYPGFSLHDELQIFVEEAGFTPLEALQTATINPAIFLEKENEMGTVETGKRANLVLLNANPLDDINNTRKIEAIILRGKYMDGDSLKRGIDAIAAKNMLPKIKDTIKPIILERGIETGISEYHQLRENHPDQYNFDEEQLNSLGYTLLGLEMAEEAVQIFELNVKIYPEYANGFDSLGDGYLAVGDTTKTIEVWKKAIVLGNTITQGRLDELLKNLKK